MIALRTAIRIAVFCLLGIWTIGCRTPETHPNRTERVTGKSLSETVMDHRQHLLSIEGVLRVEGGTCGSDSCIKVYVDKKTPIVTAQIPLMLETWQVDIIEER